jgi:uncharacterized membrane protein
METTPKRKKGASLALGKRLFGSTLPDHRFKLRGEEITRIETLSDAVFAFTISILIMALEVPQTFGELKQILQSFLPFVATVALVFLFWYQQYRFFRYYGINDRSIIILNAALLILVLFYVYPLKFLFSLLFGMITHINFFQKATEQGLVVLTAEDFPQLVMVYSAGYAAIWFVFYLMYKRAWYFRKKLKLDAFEMEDTRKQIRGALLDTFIGLLSLLFAWLKHPGLGGICFLLVIPALVLNGAYSKKRIKNISHTIPV